MPRRPTTLEAPVSIPVELLAFLLRCGEERLTATVHDLPEAQRAALAIYCFERYHMRRLGFAVALLCSQASLEAVGGAAGRQVFDLARNAASADVDETTRQRRTIAAARAAA